MSNVSLSLMAHTWQMQGIWNRHHCLRVTVMKKKQKKHQNFFGKKKRARKIRLHTYNSVRRVVLEIKCTCICMYRCMCALDKYLCVYIYTRRFTDITHIHTPIQFYSAVKHSTNEASPQYAFAPKKKKRHVNHILTVHTPSVALHSSLCPLLFLENWKKRF